MEICYDDTEFLEDGQTIDLISIGMARDDGAEYYAVSSDMPVQRIFDHPWLRQHVIPSLPVRNAGSRQLISVNLTDPAVKPRTVIAGEVRDFILACPDPQLWAWYGAYDHVALCQLWGPMAQLPHGIPMWTNDLRQESERLGNPRLPPMPGIREYHALDDAREVRCRRRWLEHAAASADGH